MRDLAFSSRPGSAAFTLIELMIVIAITVIIGAVTIVKINSSSSQQDLRVHLLGVRNALAVAQSKALGRCHHFVLITQRTYQVNSFTGSKCLSISTSDIDAGANWDPVAPAVELPGAVTGEGTSPQQGLIFTTGKAEADQIIFDTDGRANIANPSNGCHITLKHIGLNSCRYIRVTKSGTIKVVKRSEVSGDSSCSC